MKQFQLKPQKLESIALAYENCAFVALNDYAAMLPAGATELYLEFNAKPFLVKKYKDCASQTIQMSSALRMLLYVTMIGAHGFRVHDLRDYDVLAEVGFQITAKKALADVDTDVLFDSVSRYLRQSFVHGECACFAQYGYVQLELQPYVRGADGKAVFGGFSGVFGPLTAVSFSVAEQAKVKPQLLGGHVDNASGERGQLAYMFRALASDEVSGGRDSAIYIDINPIGIGGLNAQFTEIFRRAFVSRMFPAALVRRYKLQHVRGLLLYGPPGTGKTLIARKIGELLGARAPKIVSGPEVLDMYVGNSEKNVRALFEDAEKEWRERGEESGLHIIIMDELDAICKQRGSRGDSTGTYDSIINYLLAKLDGVEALGNILVVGMTNRKDLIDSALLRPGRFEVHVEVSLPNLQGRKEILIIHTQTLRENKALAANVDLDSLAERAANFSGAEIAGLVRSAQSFAMARVVSGQNVVNKAAAGPDSANTTNSATTASGDNYEFCVTQEDFDNAFHEVHAGFGKCDMQLLQQIQQFGFMRTAGNCDILTSVEQKIASAAAADIHLASILLYSDLPGTGKSALLAEICKNSRIEFIKFLSADILARQATTETARAALIAYAFDDANRVDRALLILDGLEQIVQFAPLGMRYSSAILQALVPALRSAREGHVVVLASCTQRDGLRDMGLFDCFATRIEVTPLSVEQQESVIGEWCEAKNAEFEVKGMPQALRRRDELAAPVTIQQLMLALEYARGVAAGGVITEHNFAAQIDDCCPLQEQ